MFSITTMASSTTKPVEMVSAISDRLSRLKPTRYITANVPISETGTATVGISVARGLRRNRKTTRDHQADGDDERALHVLDRCADGGGAIEHDGDIDPRRQRSFDRRQLAADLFHGLDDVGAGLAKDR